MKNFFISIIKPILRFLIRVLNKNFIWNELKLIQEERLEIEKKNILSRIMSCGFGLNVNGKIFISDPQFLTIGNNVQIGENACLVTDGGLSIGDNTRILPNFTVYTSNPQFFGAALPYDNINISKPVAIGRNVFIGANVTIVPGIQIGNGAIIEMGTVVTQHVPEMAIVGNSPFNSRGFRDRDQYNRLDKAHKYAGVKGELLSKDEFKSFGKNANDPEIQTFFGVTTGRAGSKTLSNVLSGHPSITCFHEPRMQLIRLSTEFAHGLKTYEETQEELYALYCNSGVFFNNFYGEIDLKLFNLISILADIIPRSKFIWLIRDGRDVVASTYARGWFRPNEAVNSNPKFSALKWVLSYRLNGSLCGEMTKERWEEISVFERNCWNWSFVNRKIYDQLSSLPKERWCMLKIEEIQQKLPDMFNFLGVNSLSLKIPKLNKTEDIRKLATRSIKKTEPWQTWDSKKRNSFEKWCSQEMDSWYPDWKNERGKIIS